MSFFLIPLHDKKHSFQNKHVSKISAQKTVSTVLKISIIGLRLRAKKVQTFKFWTQTNRPLILQKTCTAIPNIFFILKDSTGRWVKLEIITNLDARGTKSSIIHTAAFFLQNPLKNILLNVNCRPSNIRLLHTYEVNQVFFVTFNV